LCTGFLVCIYVDRDSSVRRRHEKIPPRILHYFSSFLHSNFILGY
jgi:hypothetical protein